MNTNATIAIKELEQKDNLEDKILIDASILAGNWEEILETHDTIVITSVTIRELDALKVKHKEIGREARKLIKRAIEEDETRKFEYARIEEKHNCPDDNILEFCQKNNLKLYTADQIMYLKATKFLNMNAVLVEEITERTLENQNNNHNQIPNDRMHLECSEYDWKNKKLTINLDDTDNQVICVWSWGKLYDCGEVELKLGDSIFECTKSETGIKFSHYRVVKISPNKNVNRITNINIESEEDLIKTSNRGYLLFINQAKQKLLS